MEKLGIHRLKLDIFLGFGMAFMVIVTKILGSFCDFMIAAANVQGIVQGI